MSATESCMQMQTHQARSKCSNEYIDMMESPSSEYHPHLRLSHGLDGTNQL